MSILHAHTRVGVRVQKSILQKNTRVFFVTKKIIKKTTAGSSQSCETQAKPTCGRADDVGKESRGEQVARLRSRLTCLRVALLRVSRALQSPLPAAGARNATLYHPASRVSSPSSSRPVPASSGPRTRSPDTVCPLSLHCLSASTMDGWMDAGAQQSRGAHKFQQKF